MTRTRKALINGLVLAGASCIGLVVCEFAGRLVVYPADYLNVEMTRDEVLGAVPSRNTKAGGFDEWGFRNREVPKAVDIVAIGDSHTYGNTSTMQDSWPYVLGKLQNRSVYNMGLGGYGPNQYFEILRTKALALKPKMIICGLYMGDDFENAFLITYGLKHWSYLRALPPEQVNFDIWEAPPAPTWHKKLRLWLSRHSVTYQILFHASILASFTGNVQIRNAHQIEPSATAIYLPDEGIEEAFVPKGIMRRLDLSSASVREGMRIAFNLLDAMNKVARQHGIDFTVVVIPTKEMVFAEELEHKPGLPLGDTIDRLLVNERLARQRTFEFLTSSGIRYVDVLPALARRRKQTLYARSSGDMHPNRNGYRVIAETVNESLAQSHAGAR